MLSVAPTRDLLTWSIEVVLTRHGSGPRHRRIYRFSANRDKTSGAVGVAQDHQ